MDLSDKILMIMIAVSFTVGCGSFYLVPVEHKHYELLAFKQFLFVILLTAFLFVIKAIING